MNKQSGGPAFPRPIGFNGLTNHQEHEASESQDGMELRDYFAAQVISQCRITVIREEPEPDAEVVKIYAERYARTAYVIADAMLAERAKP